MMSVPFLSLSLWDVGMGGWGGRQRLIMENGEEREKGGEIQLAKTDFGCTSGSGTVLKMFSSVRVYNTFFFKLIT